MGWWGIAALGLAVLCCAGPVLLASLAAAGALGTAGAVLRDPLVITAAGLIVLAVLVTVALRRHHHR